MKTPSPPVDEGVFQTILTSVFTNEVTAGVKIYPGILTAEKL